MAAFFDDKPLVAGVNEDWDEHTTGTQIMRPDWDFSPIRMRTMHHLPQIFFDTLRPERPDCPVLIPSSFSRSRDRVISMDIYSYEPCGLPTGNFMPAEQAQMCLMTASPVTLHACIPAPDQVTPEQAYFKDLDFYKKTLFHTPFLSRGRAFTLLEYRDAKIVFEVDDWFSLLPQAVQRYLLPLQSMYAKWYDQNVRDLTQNYSYCALCKTKQTNLQRHHMQHHARWRTIWFCPIPGCPSSLSSKEGLVKHLQSRPRARGIELNLGRRVAKQIMNQNQHLPLNARLPQRYIGISITSEMYLLLYNELQMNQDIRHRAQTRKRLVNALDRHWNYRAHGHPAKRMALHYLPVTEEITPPITPPRAQRQELDTATEVVPETPPPATKPGRSRGRGTWRAQQKTAPGVGTRSRTKLAELEKRENAQAQAAHVRWPPSPDITENIQEVEIV